MKVVILYGYPASGKLTVGKELIKILPEFKLVHNHLLLQLGKSFIDGYSENLFSFYSEILKQCLVFAQRYRVNLIHTLVFHKHFTAQNMLEIEKYAEDLGIEVVYVELNPTREELLSRVSSDSRKVHGKILDPEKLKESLEVGHVFLPKLDRAVLKIDNSNLSAIETAQLIKDKLSL